MGHCHFPIMELLDWHFCRRSRRPFEHDVVPNFDIVKTVRRYYNVFVLAHRVPTGLNRVHSYSQRAQVLQ